MGLSKTTANLFFTLRCSIGDFDFSLISRGDNDEPAPLDSTEQYLFLFIWFLTVLFGALIFLNFIIAEVSKSYETVKEDLDALIYKERAKLVMQVEYSTMAGYKGYKEGNDNFPRYILSRQAAQ